MPAFLLVTITTAYLLYDGYQKVQSIYNQSYSIITEQQAKNVLLSTMYNVARERLIIVLKMSTEKDVFELDELNQSLGEQARLFMVTRQQLLTMKLDKEERELIDRHGAAASKYAPIVAKVAELYIEDKHLEAKILLYEQAVPGQNIMLEMLDKIFRQHRKNTIIVTKNMRANYEVTSRHFKLLAGLLFITSFIFVIFLMTTISRREKQQLEILLAEQRKSAEKLSYLAMHDELTKLPNRRHLEEYVDRMIAHAERYKEKMALLYIDLDGFKAVNDKLSHEAGDVVLKTITDKFKAFIRSDEFIARIGGDEFCLVVNKVSNRDELKYTAQRLIKKCSGTIPVAGKNVEIGMSIGISSYPENGKKYRDLLSMADKAMYDVKKENKGSFLLA